MQKCSNLASPSFSSFIYSAEMYLHIFLSPSTTSAAVFCFGASSVCAPVTWSMIELQRWSISWHMQHLPVRFYIFLSLEVLVQGARGACSLYLALLVFECGVLRAPFPRLSCSLSYPASCPGSRTHFQFAMCNSRRSNKCQGVWCFRKLSRKSKTAE